MSAILPQYIDVDIELDNGTRLSKLTHSGKVYVEAPRGKKWKLRISNRTKERIEVVPTVDGLSVMDGEDGSYSKSGYLIPAYGLIVIPGFRLDADNVARFKFNAKGASYAAKTGRPRNVGVIGVAVFPEKYTPPPPPREVHHYHHDYWPWMSPPVPYFGGNIILRDCSLDGFQECSCSEVKTGGGEVRGQCLGGGTQSINYCAPVQNVGTEFGEKSDFRTHEVAFERASSCPAEVVEIFYDDRAGLRSKGISLYFEQTHPTPFPKTGCKPPKGWKARKS